MNDLTTSIEQLITICHLLYAKGFVAATDGNVSIRLGNGNFLTTRSGVNKGAVTVSDLVEVCCEGRPVNPDLKPSTEFGMHLYIYTQRPDVNAVVHAHPVYSTGFAAARQPLVSCVFPEIIVGLGAIPLAEYATPSTPEVAESLAPFVHNADAILLANHGVVTYGKDILDAYYKMEKVEQSAQITFVARMLGGETLLSQEDIEKLQAISMQSYGKDFSQKIACSTEESQGETSHANTLLIVREMMNG